jgi:hypothetical protein
MTRNISPYKGGRTAILNVRILPKVKEGLATYVAEMQRKGDATFSMADFVEQCVTRELQFVGILPETETENEQR